MSILIRNAVVVTVNDGMDIHDPGSVYIDNGRIAAVGPTGSFESRFPVPATTIEADGRIVLPGFVSLHNHLGYTIFRGLSEEVGHRCVTGMYYPMGTVILDEERRAVGSLNCAELLASGVTTIVEMEENAGIHAPFIEKVGMRAEIGVMIHDVDVDRMARGEFAFDDGLRDRQLQTAVDLCETWHGRADGRIRAIMAPNMTISSSPELLRACRREADRRGIRLSMHLGWGPEEVDVIARLHGVTPFEYARDHGALAPDTIMAHCLYAGEADREVLARSRTAIAHCPLMNAVRGHIAPIRTYIANGNTVGLGIDNMFADHLDVLRASLLMARVLDDDPLALKAPDALRLATIEGARALGRADELGSLEAGKIADLIVVDTTGPGMRPLIDPVANLVYHAHARDVETVIVDGRIVVAEGRPVAVDLAGLASAAQDAALAAWSRFRRKYGGMVAGAPLA